MTGDITTLELTALDGLHLLVHLYHDPHTNPAHAGLDDATRQAHAAGSWQYIAITVEAADLDHIDLQVSRNGVVFGSLPTGRIDVTHLMNVDPVPQMITQYRAQLAALTIRLAELDLATPNSVPLALSTDELSQLRTWLGTTQRRWQEAAADAEAAAARPPQQQMPRPGHLNVEPHPSGYRAIGQLARAELARIEQFGKRLDKLARLADTSTDEAGR